MSDTHNKLHYGNKQNQWKILHIILRPIYTEKLPGVATHDSLFVLLRPGSAVHERRITRRNKTSKGLHLATPGTSSV